MSFLTRYPVEFPSNMGHVFRNVIQIEPFVVGANYNSGAWRSRSRTLNFLYWLSCVQSWRPGYLNCTRHDQRVRFQVT